MAFSPQAVVVSDLHLNATARSRTTKALASVLRRYPQAELILNGDVFEFSMFPAAEAPAAVLATLCGKNPEFVRLLSEHLGRGSAVTFIAGNHDAALAQLAEPLREQLNAVGRLATERLVIAPWFVRRGRVHIEHGHAYDPDNAPLHPLASFQAESEPLGPALMRRFVARTGAREFAHAHDTTPLQGVARAFKLYGAKAPQRIASYFQTALALSWEAATCRRAQTEAAQLEGRRRLPSQALEQALDLSSAEALCGALAAPTHADFGKLVARLYLDAVLAGALGTSALLPWVLAGSAPALGALLLASGYLAATHPAQRYRGRPCRELRAAAEHVANVTAASRVVFGHTHVEEDVGPYFNLGSFTYCHNGGHPHALVFDGERVERGHIS